jgi:hypothetical protein
MIPLEHKAPGLGTSRTTLVLFQALVVAADLIVLYTGNAFLPHGAVMSHPELGEPPFFSDQYIQHHSHHGQADKNNGYD